MDRLKKIAELRRTLNELRELGASIKENFSVFEKFIGQEKFPEVKLLEKVGNNFLTWASNVNKSFELYEELFDGDKPRTFSELEKILGAEEKKIIEANIFAQAEKFLHLTTKNLDVKKILERHQKKLKALLAKKSRDKVEPYAKFIEATATNDFGKKFSLGKELSDIFGDEFIGRALIGKELFFEDELDMSDNDPDESPTETNDFAEILRKKGALLTDEDFAPFEKSLIVETCGREREINSRRFKRDFDSPNIIKLVLFKTLTNGGFAACTVPVESKFPQEHFDGVAQLLVNKGYFQKYTFDNVGHFYCLTKNCFDFLKGEDLKKFFKGTDKEPLSEPREELLIDEEISRTLTRMVYFRFYAVEREQNNFRDGRAFFNQAFRVVFVSRSERDLVLGCFWNHGESGNGFLSELKTYLSDNKKIHRLIIAGLNRQHGEKIFDALETALAEDFPKDMPYYVYAFNENTFYIRGTEETILPEKIWADPSPDAEPLVDDKKPVDKKPVDKKSDDKKSDDKKFVDKKTVDKKSDDKKTVDKKTVDKKSDDKKTVVEITDETLPNEMRALNEMFFAKKFYCATAYLKALSLQDDGYTPLYYQLAYAINDPFLAISYDADKILTLFENSQSPEEYFLTAATLRTFFYNHKQFDNGMKNLHGIVKNFAVVEQNPPLAELIFTLMNFKGKAKNGADYYADYREKNRSQTENKIGKIQQEAQTCLDKIKNFKDKAFNPRFIALKKILFDGSELTDYLEYTIKDAFDEEILRSMKKYLRDTFIKDGASLTIENIDNLKLDNVIDEAWREAGNKVAKKINSKLVGALRNNVITSLKTAIEILCERIKCFEESAPLQSDAGVVEYKRIRKSLIDNVKDAQKILAGKKVAAANVLIETLQEIADKLEGTFHSTPNKYFYIDFLRGDKVLLDENYMPNFNFNTLDGTNTPIGDRIIAHSRAELPTFAERIKNIFENKGWDFGSAKLIWDYFKEIKDDSLTVYELQDSIDAVKRITLDYKKKFFGFLELAQSYGQFDDAPENTKEKILKLIDRCFEFAQASSNYGVFVRVKEYWENKTKEDAAKYAVQVEKKLELGIKNYCRKANAAEDSPALQKNIARIQKMIDRRNYTVAQGLINLLSEGKLYETEQSSEQTHLQRFLADHTNYYLRVSKNGESLKKLFDRNPSFFKAATSKGIKGGGILIDNWLPNGFPQNGDVGEDRLKKLLAALGFKVKDVKKTSAIDKKALNYKVTLLPPLNGQSSNYNHHIADFGSNAEIYGFRVTCLFGYYDAAGLTARFKEIGNAEHTLVLLDYALELQTLRSLAREIKAESTINKVFAVIDRVILMYLIKNYDEMQINKMLMSLIMPFAACQPYVFNPNVPIPPEIFIGRAKEMGRILDFDDVNIVYGGRQLGKTALLKMACASLDRNENNDRAVFIDINKCNCADAALKISKALRSEKFFDETFIDTDDWAQLTAAIKERLMSDKPDKIWKFMLALDEADDFIEDCRKIDFKPVLELIDIQQQRHNGSRFKFVMAGLRDVVRFYKDELLGNNNQISKLPSLVVKPFELADANKLLREPLRCLGLYFSDDENSDSLAIMILETTNYFPGLIQLYCARLIEALSGADYAGYNETVSPVYEITEGHIQSVLGDEKFNEEIKNKINMTLRLGNDKFYYVIAHLLAWRYHNDDDVAGYSAKDILQTAAEYGLENLLPKSIEQVEALLKELCELNILRETAKGKYLFVRQRFLNMMGTTNELSDEIMSDFSEI